MLKTISNSTLALSSAYLLTIILHEMAHYVMSIILNYEATLYHNKVWTKTIGVDNHDMIIAGVAPIFSLLLGLVAYRLAKSMTPSSKSLFVLWFGVAGIITFFGYLMIAPLIPIGDTGKVFALLGIPMWIQIIISLLSVALITYLLIKSTRQFERFAIDDFGSTKDNRTKWAMSLILFPLLISIVVITAFQFPIPHIASILATVCAPFSIMAIFGTFIGNKETLKRDLLGKSINSNLSYQLILLFIFSITINRLLVNGVQFF